MSSYVNGAAIKAFRERCGLTQKKLAEKIGVSDKTVSKWETDRGLPDISLLGILSEALGISLTELISGKKITNKNMSGNMLRGKFYVCPICGNVIHAMGQGSFSCCGIDLPPLEAEPFDEEHLLELSRVEYDHYLTLPRHPMERGHYISFMAYVTTDRLQLVKLYPQQEAESRFPICGDGLLYVYCSRHGLFYHRV